MAPLLRIEVFKNGEKCEIFEFPGREAVIKNILLRLAKALKRLAEITKEHE
jgi:hypothetical protein